MNDRRALAVSLLVGLAVGTTSHSVLVPDAVLSAALALFYAAGVRLLIRFDPQLAGSGRASVGKWGGAFAGLVTLAGTVGVSPSLPVSTDLRFALGLLVIGVGATAFGLGAGMAFAAVAAAEEGDRAKGTDAAPEAE